MSRQQLPSISRSPTGRTDPKLREVIRQDFFAGFFCLGVTSVGLSEAAYTRLTAGYLLSLASARHPS